MAKIHELHFWLSTHRIYQIQPPVIFSCFLTLKYSLEDRDENAYFAKKFQLQIVEELKKLEHRWKKCISLKGRYVEKQKQIWRKLSCLYLGWEIQIAIVNCFLTYCELISKNLFFFSPRFNLKIYKYYYQKFKLKIDKCNKSPMNVYEFIF